MNVPCEPLASMTSLSALLPAPRAKAVPVCDCCRRVENAEGRWQFRRRKEFPDAHSIVLDFCPDCCADYVSLLLKPARSLNGFSRTLLGGVSLAFVFGEG
jgi:hypothetical protein